MAAPVMDTCHVSCCANRTPNVVSWGRGGLIAFGTCNSVALYNPRVGTVCLVLVHLLLQFTACAVCSGHSGPVCAVDAMSLSSSQLLVASASSDSTVKLWTCSSDTGKIGSVIITSLAVPVLACGGDASRVHLYVQLNGQFQRLLTLTGHEDWVRCVEWATKDGELWLASCSQDCLIRVWRLFAKTATEPDQQADAVIKMKENVFQVSGDGEAGEFAVTLETVLAGHENWVYGIHWQPPCVKGDSVEQPLKLLSASMDKTMILWGPEEDSGMWVELVRVGEVGGNTLGFYGCQMSPDGFMILAHAFHGALHLWHCDTWRPSVVISGHFNAVQDLSWDPEGEFIITVGSDQTTRLFTPWTRNGCSEITWHEISRPQIHGYDMQCLTMVGRFQFVSGADEKVLRVFKAPRNFVENFANISCTSLEKLLGCNDIADLPEGASTPALGLSNKAVFQGMNPLNSEDFNSLSDQYKESYFQPLKLTEPPTEDDLLQNTLWPEVQKLYGHGFEMFCLASDSERTVVASACKASKPEHAAILLWSTTSWKQLQSLPCHSLTVTQMAFSPNGRLLLTVSRDRTWSLWRRGNPDSDTESSFSLYANTSKDTAVHARIIWSCDWSSDSKYFVTSSRDKKVIIWGHCGSGVRVGECEGESVTPCSSVLDVGDSATAVSICPYLCSDQSYLLAVGLENGKIVLYKWRPSEDLSSGADWSRCGETDACQSHTLTVKRLRWRPRPGRAGHGGNEERAWVQLASAGADHVVKIFNIKISAL
uniref:Elongator complex protein 2 n=1 Tax=Sinocyclocheilus grahami TaxID=75366 RepID=A0A672SFT9_SINGR